MAAGAPLRGVPPRTDAFHMERLWSRAWLLYLAASGVAMAAYFGVLHGPAQNIAYDLAAASSALAIVAGVRHWQPVRRLPWYLLAIGQTMTLVGELVYDWYDLIRHVDAPVPSLADAGFLIGYVFTISGVVTVARSFSSTRDRGPVLDATIVATGIGLLWWVFVVQPTVSGTPGNVLTQVVTLAYPLMDALLLFVMLRLGFAGALRIPAFVLLALSIAATLVADVAYNVTNLVGVYADGSLMDAGWLAGFVLMGTAALNPTMRWRAKPLGTVRTRAGRARLALLAAASLMAPLTLIVANAQGRHDAIPWIAAASAVMFGLVVVRMAGLHRDVASRVEQLDARSVELEHAEAKYRTVVEHIPAVTFLQHVDPHDLSRWRTVYISPQVEAMFGYTPEEWLRERPWVDLVDPQDRERILAADKRRIVTGDPVREEYRMRARDGRNVWVHAEVVRVGSTNEGPELWHVWHGVIFDITAHKLAEDVLRTSLEREREAARRLVALDEMKSTFLHAVSHDLRTPLAAIMGAALTLEREDLPIPEEDRRDLLRRLSTNARKLDRLLADLLDLNMLDRGIVEPRRTPTDLGALARSLVAESDVLAGREVILDADPGTADVDAAKVERILDNLLRNAARHTPAGTPVWVRVRLQDDGALLMVEDAGPGVPRHVRGSIFEPFAQGPSPAGPHTGVGIGLSLVGGFAQLHGGRAWVEDRVGGGASFHVFLPGAVHRALASPPSREDAAGSAA
jgi:PAS domain S-box-containing protein